MKSIVLDLQQAAMDSAASVPELLRKAIAVARKLAVREMQEQLTHEMNGYTADAVVPSYRIVHGQIKAWNPYHGWIPIMIQDSQTANRLTTRSVYQSIGELEVLANSEGKGALQMTLPPKIQNWIMEDMDVPLQPILHISKPQIHRILDAVRNAVLDWSLKLEEQGILGEGLAFTSEEKQRAASVVYNIQSVTGVVGGNVTADTIQIGSYNSIHQKLKDLGVPQEDRNELETIMDSIPASPSKEKKSFIQRGLEWVERHKDTLGSLGRIIKEWFDHQ
jgi:hypothetical protein